MPREGFFQHGTSESGASGACLSGEAILDQLAEQVAACSAHWLDSSAREEGVKAIRSLVKQLDTQHQRLLAADIEAAQQEAIRQAEQATTAQELQRRERANETVLSVLTRLKGAEIGRDRHRFSFHYSMPVPWSQLKQSILACRQQTDDQLNFAGAALKALPGQAAEEQSTDTQEKAANNTITQTQDRLWDKCFSPCMSVLYSTLGGGGEAKKTVCQGLADGMTVIVQIVNEWKDDHAAWKKQHRKKKSLLDSWRQGVNWQCRDHQNLLSKYQLAKSLALIDLINRFLVDVSGPESDAACQDMTHVIEGFSTIIDEAVAACDEQRKDLISECATVHQVHAAAELLPDVERTHLSSP